MYCSKLVSNIFILLAVCASLTLSTVSTGDKPKQPKQLKVKKGPQDESVLDRGLVNKEPLAKDILVENGGYYKNTTIKRFSGPVLGYVTAWNGHGYDVAKIFARKFNMISPVWFQIVRSPKGYDIAGQHDIDVGWINDIRTAGASSTNNLEVFPRVIFERFTEKDFTKLLTQKDERNKMNEVIIRTCLKYKFEGIVLELWSQLAGRVDDRYLYNLILDLSKHMESVGLKLILVIPPTHKDVPNLFNKKHFEYLYPHVYAFSLMTYDYSNIQRPGANAPLHWIRSSIEDIVPQEDSNFQDKRRKILMGINMYGNDYTPSGGGPIIGPQYLELVKHVKKRLTYDEHDVENFFEVRTSTGRHTVFYPSLYSINERIKLAEEMGVGISLWELGQGLDYFYDLF